MSIEEKKIKDFFDKYFFALGVVKICGQGEGFGELALISEGQKRNATVITMEETEFMMVSKGKYEDILSNIQ